jgi:rhodanese-related sulfurtransferase
MADGTARIVDLGPSMRFRSAHMPGSRWSIRSRIVSDVAGGASATHPTKADSIVLVADDPNVARLASIDLIEAGVKDIRLLAGGFAAWTKAGYATDASADVPPDDDCIDYLFFVHDRHAGNLEAMRQYLAWETGLIAQLDGEDRKLFPVGRTTP